MNLKTLDRLTRPMSMQSSKFKITLKGSAADDSVRLNDLVDQLSAIRHVLTQIDLDVSGGRSATLYYRVVSITMNSPAIFEVEAVPSKAASKGHGRRVVSKFYRDLGSVISGRRPKDADLELLESYRVLALPMKKHLEAVSVHFDGKTTEIPRNLDVRVDEILGPDQVEIGSVVGSLEVLDVHNQKNLFKIFPVVGPRSIKCLFDKRMLRDAIDGIDHFVKVSGQLHFKKTEKFPHLIKVTAIEVLPERSDAPKLSSLRGMATDAYGGMSSTDYIEKVRNGDW